MRKFIKLERIRANRESIQKKLNKKLLNRGIVTCVIAIALISSYNSSAFQAMSMAKNFRFIVSRPMKRKLHCHLMRPGEMMIPRESWTF